MRSIFRPIDTAEREAAMQAYAAFLTTRDGEPDFAHRRLPKREVETSRFEQPDQIFDVGIDPTCFAEQYRRFDGRRDTSDETLLLLCCVKTNANESYAVDQVWERPLKNTGLAEHIERILLVEEIYHTRLLVSTAALFGVGETEPIAPVPMVRAMITAIADAPQLISRPVTLAGEVVGILTFLRLLDVVRRVSRDRPALRDALEERLIEVVIDEVGHLSFNRILATNTQLALSRVAVPMVALGTRGALPEAERLGILPLPLAEVNRFDFDTLPEEVRRRSFIA